MLDDPRKTAVISQRGMGEALGLSSRGNSFPRFLATRSIAEVAGAELREKLENPLKFQWGGGGAEQPPATVHGFDVGLLIDLCNAIIAAEDALGRRYERVAQQAHVIVGASAKNGIKGLVYALAGYNPTTEDDAHEGLGNIRREQRQDRGRGPPDDAEDEQIDQKADE